MSELADLARTAYVWGSALVAAARLRQNVTRPDDPLVDRPASSGAAPMNNIGHQRALSDPELTVGVAPNVDTLYSLAWLDLDDAAFVFETPDFGGRYYTFQIGHSDTECDFCPGLRTHGSQLPPLFIHGPAYDGRGPDGMLAVAGRNRYLMIAGRVLVEPENPSDVHLVRTLQEQIRLRTLTRWQAGEDGPNPIPAQRVLPTAADVADPELLFLHQLGVVLGERVAGAAEQDLLRSLVALGLSTRGGFDPSAISASDRADVIAGLRAGELLVDDKIGHLGTAANGWTVNLQGPRFGGDHLLRAAVAKNQIFVVPAEEAVYPVTRVDGHGDRLVGTNRYRWLLESSPPADAFWSLTVYGTPGPLVANALDRYAIGDRTPGLCRGDDRSLSISLQHDQPSDGTANWLPTPAGEFHLMLRLYWPRKSVLDGRWFPPSVERIDTTRPASA